MPEFSNHIKILRGEPTKTENISCEWINEDTVKITHNFNEQVDYIIRKNGYNRVIPVDYLDNNQTDALYIKFSPEMLDELQYFDLFLYKLTKYNKNIDTDITNENTILYDTFLINKQNDFSIPVSSFYAMLRDNGQNGKDQLLVESIIRELEDDEDVDGEQQVTLYNKRVLFGTQIIETKTTKRAKNVIKKLKFFVPDNLIDKKFSVTLYVPPNIQLKQFVFKSQDLLTEPPVISEDLSYELIDTDMNTDTIQLKLNHNLAGLVNYIIKADNGISIKLSDISIIETQQNADYNKILLILNKQILENISTLNIYLYRIYIPQNQMIIIEGE